MWIQLFFTIYTMSFNVTGYHDIDSNMNTFETSPSMISTDEFDAVYHSLGPSQIYAPTPAPPAYSPSALPAAYYSTLHNNWSQAGPGNCVIVPTGTGQFQTQKQCLAASHPAAATGASQWMCDNGTCKLVAVGGQYGTKGACDTSCH